MLGWSGWYEDGLDDHYVGLNGHKDSVNVYKNGKYDHLGFRMLSEHLEGHWGV